MTLGRTSTWPAPDSDHSVSEVTNLGNWRGEFQASRVLGGHPEMEKESPFESADSDVDLPPDPIPLQRLISLDKCQLQKRQEHVRRPLPDRPVNLSRDSSQKEAEIPDTESKDRSSDGSPATIHSMEEVPDETTFSSRGPNSILMKSSNESASSSAGLHMPRNDSMRLRKLQPHPAMMGVDQYPSGEEHLMHKSKWSEHLANRNFTQHVKLRIFQVVVFFAAVAVLLLEVGFLPMSYFPTAVYIKYLPKYFLSASFGCFLMLLLLYDCILSPHHNAPHREDSAVHGGLQRMRSRPQLDIDWSKKIRIFIGTKDSAVIFKHEKGGHLDTLVDTASFRDSILEYANNFWTKKFGSPAQALTLEVIDYGDVEIKDEDGKVHSKMQKVPMFIPNNQGSVQSCPDRQANAQMLGVGWMKRIFSHNNVSISDTSYAPLTDRGDIQLGVGEACQPSSTTAGEDKSGAAAAGDVSMFLDVYGSDAFDKVQNLIHDVIHSTAHRPKPTKVVEEKGETKLHWWTLIGWENDKSSRGKTVPIPVWKKAPIHGDRTYQTNYHYSFFHPKKHQLLGSRMALLDQFRDGTGNFAVPGAQRKLNFLLHGPPGTGKSKFVRTMAMYLQRNVVSFTLSQVETELQFMTLLEDLSCIKDSRWEEDTYTYKDVLFVIEEIDTDPRGVCLARTTHADSSLHTDDEDPGGASPGQQASSADETVNISPPPKGRGRKAPKIETKDDSKGPANSHPLSLGVVLRTLDGSCETPFRVIVLTTNREEMLDEAFKRPGRLKKVLMENLAYPEFKQMILHFRRSEARVPTMHLWTLAIDEMARTIMADFKALQEKRAGALDIRGLGLSPALLEELCMESQSLQQLFILLHDEIKNQCEKANLGLLPKSASLMKDFDWRMHAVRQTVMFHIKDPQKYQNACRSWPEVGLTQCESPDADRETDTLTVEGLVYRMLKDEKTFNEAIELCPQDHGDRYEQLRYRLQMELATGLLSLDANSGLGSVLGTLMNELEKKWRLAWSLDDSHLRALLENEWPPSSSVVQNIPELARSRSFQQSA
eukprot:gnl/MRDRNA2_/MRDRNA2_65273_c0_seq1.p1 gnl/MRDRNA2_/MRDRNA2_65273_c0~~gnl/MRDRNA2_/MRDRNA2_65273_c0_seq1.p1  ORF type:complete len:1048 (-),score=179.05 gnl/MRDRNA2_/MRDRNA2_65273_c0_seq1:424-3567(-)